VVLVNRLGKAYAFLQQTVGADDERVGVCWQGIQHLHAPSTNCTLTHSSQDVHLHLTIWCEAIAQICFRGQTRNHTITLHSRL